LKQNLNVGVLEIWKKKRVGVWKFFGKKNVGALEIRKKKL